MSPAPARLGLSRLRLSRLGLSRLRVPREEELSGHWNHPKVAARVGLALGLSFSVCFVTGLLSHLVQHPPGWFYWPPAPARLYQVTQGLHVLTGIASVPLLLIKLWTVFPRFFTTPPVRSVLHGLERLSVAALVSSALFELVTGLQNIVHWYPWGFSFPPAHYAIAWVAIGSIGLHVAIQLPAIRAGLSGPLEEPPLDDDGLRPPSRRWLLAAAVLAPVGAVLATAGQTVPGLRRVSVLAARTGDGPQGVPVNKTAAAARVRERALDPAWRLRVSGPGGALTLSLRDLEAMPQHTVQLPIACVEGWSATAEWQGVRLRDLADAVGVPPTAELRFDSLQPGGAYRSSVLPAPHVRASATLVALRINGERLSLDHGYPARLIAPSRPGVLQTKWLASISVEQP